MPSSSRETQRLEEEKTELLKAKIRKYASVQHNASQNAKDREMKKKGTVSAPTHVSQLLSTSDETKSSPKSVAAVEKSASSSNTSPKLFLGR